MAANTRARPAATPAERPPLPPLTVAKLEQCMLLIERLVAEKTSIFAEHANRYRFEWREASTRTLTADEAASITAGLSASIGDEDTVGLVERIQASGLRAQDEPPHGEVLLAAGASTAPAFLDAALRLVALVEMPNTDLEENLESDNLDVCIMDAVADLKRLSVRDAKAAATRALDHFSDEAGVTVGETVGLVSRLVGEALSQALSPALALSSLTGSLAPTDGPAETSSTEPGGETP